MEVHYTRATEGEEIAMLEAIEKILCPNAKEDEHECRMHFVSWQTVPDDD